MAGFACSISAALSQDLKPLASLSWFGAEIIKVEWPEYPGLDWMRHIGPFHGGVDTGNTAANFNNINTGKLSITLDLRLREGQELVRRLINISDVVLEAYSPTVMARQGA